MILNNVSHPFDMKGCICHFTRWQIHPSYPRRTINWSIYGKLSAIHQLKLIANTVGWILKGLQPNRMFAKICIAFRFAILNKIVPAWDHGREDLSRDLTSADSASLLIWVTHVLITLRLMSHLINRDSDISGTAWRQVTNKTSDKIPAKLEIWGHYLGLCWASVADGEPALTEQWFGVLCLAQCWLIGQI